MITEAFLFLFFWFIFCGAWHETMHLFEAERQRCISSYMWVALHRWHGIPYPSMHYTAYKTKDLTLVKHAGGLYSSFTASIVSIIFSLRGDFFVAYILLGLSIIQLAYGLFEGSKYYVPKKRYWIYGIGIATIFIIWVII